MIGADLTLQLVVMRLFSGLIIATMQGFVIAAVAVALGDKGPRYDGRLTPNPARHVDLLGLGSLMLTGFGWSKFVPVEAAQLRIGRLGLAVAALAGSLALLLVGYLLLQLATPIVTQLPYTAGLTAAAFVRVAARLCVWMALFTLLPLPPLAGAHFLGALGVRLPPVAWTIAGWLLLIASVFGVTRMLLTPAYEVLAPMVLGAEAAR
ncbi:MAG TPA: hypothetical protein VFE52_10735 [Devosia sp.]|nr:hypothetical protein [Devosia sp.]